MPTTASQARVALTVRLPRRVYADASDLASVLGEPLQKLVQDAVVEKIEGLRSKGTDRLIREIREIRSRLNQES